MSVAVAVYADWDGLPHALRLGWLRAQRGAGREVFEYEFDPAALALARGALHGLWLDPDTVFRIKRFDRTPAGRRLHFASALTLTGRADGDDAASGASYLELAEALIQHGARTKADLRELWSRIVFNMLVSNTDDHLRNHGFILVPGKGWRLSEAYDLNPVPDAAGGLKLNVSEVDNALDLELARAVAPYFRVASKTAEEIIERCRATVRQWPKLAAALERRTH